MCAVFFPAMTWINHNNHWLNTWARQYRFWADTLVCPYRFVFYNYVSCHNLFPAIQDLHQLDFVFFFWQFNRLCKVAIWKDFYFCKGAPPERPYKDI